MPLLRDHELLSSLLRQPTLGTISFIFKIGSHCVAQVGFRLINSASAVLGLQVCVTIADLRKILNFI